MAETVRYGRGDNAVLRLVLYNLWGWRCYRCQRPKDFNDIQIDHIIPRHVSAQRLRELKDQYGLPSDFDLDAPGNLAPICSVCNGPRGKGKRVHVQPVVLDRLEKARELEPEVIGQVLRFPNSSRIAENLLRASQADLGDPDARKAFEEHAPAVIQKLALLDIEKVDFVSFSTTQVEIDEGSDLEVGLSLNSRGQVAALVLKDVCECAMEYVLREPVRELVETIRERVQAAFERIEGPVGPTTSGPAEISFIRVDVDSIGYERLGPWIEFAFDGNFEADLSASLVQDNIHGLGLDDIQGDAHVDGTFSFDATWSFSTLPGDLESGDCQIRSWRDEIDLTTIGPS